METTARPVGQAKRHSIYETITSTLIGFTVSYLLNLIVVPWLFKVHPSPAQNATMVGIFTVASLIRGYYTRRLFNWWHLRSWVNTPDYEIKDSAEELLKDFSKQFPGAIWTETGLYIPPTKKD